jgi:hypothetical protein
LLSKVNVGIRKGADQKWKWEMEMDIVGSRRLLCMVRAFCGFRQNPKTLGLPRSSASRELHMPQHCTTPDYISVYGGAFSFLSPVQASSGASIWFDAVAQPVFVLGSKDRQPTWRPVVLKSLRNHHTRTQ